MVVTESFLPTVNGVAGSVLRVLDHLRREGHTALVVAPGEGCDEYDGTPVVRVPAVSLPGVPVLPVGLPTRRLQQVMGGFGPDVVHLASPFVLGAGGQADRTLAPSTAAAEALVAARVGRVHRWARGVDAALFAPARRDGALRRRLAPSCGAWVSSVRP